MKGVGMANLYNSDGTQTTEFGVSQPLCLKLLCVYIVFLSNRWLAEIALHLCHIRLAR